MKTEVHVHYTSIGIIDRFNLFHAFAVGKPIAMQLGPGERTQYHIIIDSLEREDGSGYAYNVRGRDETGEVVSGFVRCYRSGDAR